jgi:hypothetical protein
MKTGLPSAMHQTTQPFHMIKGGITMIRGPFIATLRVSGQGTITPCTIARFIRHLACLLEALARTSHLNMMALHLALDMRLFQAIMWASHQLSSPTTTGS